MLNNIWVFFLARINLPPVNSISLPSCSISSLNSNTTSSSLDNRVRRLVRLLNLLPIAATNPQCQAWAVQMGHLPHRLLVRLVRLETSRWEQAAPTERTLREGIRDKAVRTPVRP